MIEENKNLPKNSTSQKKSLFDSLRIERRNQATVVLLLALIITVLLGYFVTLPLQKSYAAARLNYGNLKKEKNSLEQKQEDLRRLAREKETRAEFLSQVEDAMPTSAQIPELLVTLERIASNNNVVLTDFTPREDIVRQPVKGEKVVKYQSKVIEFNIISSYPSIKEFIKDLEDNIRPVNITSISISGGEFNNSQDVLRFNIKAEVYYKDISKQEVKQ